MFNKDLFRSACAESGKTRGDIASALGITESSLVRKMREGRFDARDMRKITELLSLSRDRAARIFMPELCEPFRGSESGKEALEKELRSV